MTFDEFKKEFGVDESQYSAEHYIIESAFKAGVASRQAEIDSLNKNIESLHIENERIQREYQMTFDNLRGRQQAIDALQEVANREREQATEYYTDFHCVIAERDALQKRIDLIVDLVHDQTIDYFLDNLIQDILKGDKND